MRIQRGSPTSGCGPPGSSGCARRNPEQGLRRLIAAASRYWPLTPAPRLRAAASCFSLHGARSTFRISGAKVRRDPRVAGAGSAAGTHGSTTEAGKGRGVVARGGVAKPITFCVHREWHRPNSRDVYGWLSRPYAEARTFCRALDRGPAGANAGTLTGSELARAYRLHVTQNWSE
jgi:hypothetical protein